MSRKKIKINVKNILLDIRSGLSDDDLIEKYNLERKQLPELFKQLVQQGFITHDELIGREIFQSTDDLTTAIFSSFAKKELADEGEDR
jgi:hypothetical protein